MDTRGYFNREAAGWSHRYQGNRHFKTRLDTVLGWISRLPDGLSVLDYGCGSGVMLHALISLDKNLDVTGVDAAPAMIEAARHTLHSLGDRAKAVLSRLETVPNPDPRYARQSYELILCLGVLEYVEDPAALLEHLTQLTGPTGRLVVSVPNRQSLLRRMEALVGGCPAPFARLGLFPHLTGPDSYLQYQKHQFTTAELDTLLARLGLSRTRLFYHVAPRLLAPWEGLASIGMTAILEYQRA